MASAATKIRLSLELTPELNDRLDQLAADMGGSKADFLRRALALAEVAIEARKRGHDLVVIDPKTEKVVTRIVGL